MKRITLAASGALTALTLGGWLSPDVAQAADFGDWMNPSKWFGGDRDRDYYGSDYYGGRGYGPPRYG